MYKRHFTLQSNFKHLSVPFSSLTSQLTYSLCTIIKEKAISQKSSNDNTRRMNRLLLSRAAFF